MLLEGKMVGVTVPGLAALIAAFGSMDAWMQDLVLAAGAIAALKLIGGTLRSTATRAREVHAAVTSDLPERMDRVEERQDDTQTEIAAINATLRTMASVDAAAVRGAIEATKRPRAARATDPGVRTGWRE